MKYVLDTDHIIYYLNNHPAVVKALQSHGRHAIAITRFTHAELLYGAYKSSNPEHNLVKIGALITEVEVLEFTEKAAHFYAKARVGLSRMGKPCPNFDLLIGSIVLANHRTLVTNNTKDFQNISGLILENWTGYSPF